MADSGFSLPARVALSEQVTECSPVLNSKIQDSFSIGLV